MDGKVLCTVDRIRLDREPVKHLRLGRHSKFIDSTTSSHLNIAVIQNDKWFFPLTQKKRERGS